MRPISFTLLQRAAVAVAMMALAASAQAAGWNEGVDGDFSNNGLAPTLVSLSAGSNTVWGTTGRAVSGGPVDLDYFTITIPAGFLLSALNVLPGTTALGDGSFIGLMAGNTFTIPPNTGNAVGMLGWTLFSEVNVGDNLLIAMSAPFVGSSGFTPPLPAGNYSFWVQETGVGVSTYGFALEVTAVPEPSTVLSMLGGLALLSVALKRRWHSRLVCEADMRGWQARLNGRA